MNVEIANKLVKLRKQMGLSQEELAEKTQVTRQTIIAIEKNKYIPSLELALKFAIVFREKIENIFEYKK